jgi:tetratricopeptide (TPR) repeat protein
MAAMTRSTLLYSAATPVKPRLVAGAAGDSASPKAMERMAEAIAELKLQAVLPVLDQALAELKAGRAQPASELALKALEVDERCGIGWRVLAIAREKAGDHTTALKCYEKALELCPEEVELANDLGRLAYTMGMKEEAETLFRHYHAALPDSVDGVNNLACCQRDRLMFGDAIETLRPAIERHPESAMLWNTLGSVMVELGEMEQALIFFNEALSLAPDFHKARYNRGSTFLALGDLDRALEDVEASIPGALEASEATMMRLCRASVLITKGDLEKGWEAYEERLDPHFADVTHFMVDAPRWTPEVDLAGKRLLLIGEQGLGDEVLFGSLLPDVLEALGPDGKLSLAVEERLVPLFQQSFPQVEVGAHRTGKVDHHTVRVAPFMQERDDLDYWAPMASPLRRFRKTLADFPARERFLEADPERVAHWKALLETAGPGPKIGVLWKSLKVDSARYRYFSPFDAWKPVLQVPGVTFVNLQYGDCAEELARAKEELGVEIWSPPGIDLKDDLADLAALCCALDLTVGPANATTNIGAAAGAATWLISTPGAWPRLGTDRYPWYPQVRVFVPDAYNQWAPVMDEVAAAVTEFAKA